ncbi:MAG: transcriptional repressor [Syntrophaceae bacterium]|nr:transcriptional repressor [Syntrophaceae bacterium]
MNRKLRATEQRKIIVDELKKLRTHPTASELYEIVRARLPRISLGTVYRNLEILSKTGKIKKLEMAGSQRRFDGFTDNHFHVKCIKCERVSDVNAPDIEFLLGALKTLNGYKVVSSHVEFSGLCPECQKNDENAQEEIMLNDVINQ